MPITIVPDNETPVLPEVGQIPGAVDPLALPKSAKDEPGSLEVIGAAFRRENTIGSSIADVNEGLRADETIDPNFDFVEAIPKRYQDQAPLYAYVNNQRQADAVTRKIDREINDRKIIDEAGVFGVVAMFGAAMFDPVNLIPVGGAGYKTYRLGGSILQGATITAKAGFLSTTAAEAVLQYTQTQRTLGEGAVNITAGTFLSGLLGGALGTFRSMSGAGRLGRAAEHAQEVAAGADPGRRSSASDAAPNAVAAETPKGVVRPGRDIPQADQDTILQNIKKDVETEVTVNQEFEAGASVDALIKDIEDGIEAEGGIAVNESRVDGLELLEDTSGNIEFSKLPDDLQARIAEITPSEVGTDNITVTLFNENLTIGIKDLGALEEVVSKPLSTGLDNIKNVDAALTNENHVVRFKAFSALLKSNGVEFDTVDFNFASRYIFVGEGDDAIKIRFADHENVSSAHPAPDFNLHDGASGKGIKIFDDVLARLGGPVRAADDFNASATVKALEDDLTVPPPDEPDILIPGSIKMTAEELAADTGPGASGGSVGAAAVNNADAKIKSALGLEKVVKFQDPLLRTATSPSIETRRIGQRLSEQVLAYDQNALGIKTPIAVETRIAAHQSGLYKATKVLDDQFALYRLGRNKKLGDIQKIAIGDLVKKPDALTSYDFKREVGRALSEDDKHEIPEVAATAKSYRELVFDPLKDDAISLGLLPEGVEVSTAPSYLMRLYNIEKIIAERPKFKGIVLEYLIEQRDLAAERAPKLQVELDTVTAELTALLREAGAVKRGQAKAERLLTEKKIALERDVAAGNKTVRRAEADLNREAKRLLEAKPSDRLSSDDPLKDFIREARRQLKEPEGLVDFIRRTGGVVDAGGDVAALGPGKTPRGKRKLIVKEGRTLDALALEAWEEGFFPLHSERPDINDLLDALDDSLRGTPVIREADLDRLAMVEELDGFHKLLDDLGVDLSKSDDEIAFALRNVVEGEDGFVKQAEGFIPSTPGRRAKTSVVQRRVKELEKRLSNDEVTAFALRERLGMVVDALADEKGFRPMMREALDQLKAGAADARKRKKTLRKEQRKADFKGRFEDIELDDVADEIIDRILGTPEGRLPYDINPNVAKQGGAGGGGGGLKGALKGRAFLIQDKKIIDFLETDVEAIARAYNRTMASQIEIIREFGDVNMTDAIKTIARDYNLKMQEPGLTPKQLKRLQSKKTADIRDIAGMRDRHLGTFGLPADPTAIGYRLGRGVSSLHYLRLLGGMTVSAIPDVWRTAMIHGLTPFIRDGLIPLIRDFKAFRMSAEQTRLTGTALDMVNDSRAMGIADVMDDFGRYSKLERGIKAAQDRFGLVTLMAPWNAFMKQLAGMVSMARMFRGIEGIAKGAPVAKEVEYLASTGIDATDAVNIWRLFEAHGEVRNGVYLPNTSEWTGAGAGEAIRNFRGSLKKQVDIIIVTPGQDKPLFASTTFGRLILQFKSFAIASVQRTMLTGLQQRDLAALNGALLSVGAGMLSYAIKQNDAGRELSDDPAIWISEGLDRSGLFGWFFDANNIIEKATRGRVGVNALLGGPPMSRYVSRNALGALLGPSFGAATDLLGVTAGAVGKFDWTEGDTRALRRLLPYQNLVGFRRVLDQAEAGINDALGVKATR